MSRVVASLLALFGCAEPEPQPPDPTDLTLPVVAPEPEPLPEPVPAPTGEFARRPPAIGLAPLPMDRAWDVLHPHDDLREMFREASGALGPWGIDVAGFLVDGPWLAAIAATPDDEPLLRAVRESSGLPLDLLDLLYFLDDVLAVPERRGEPFTLTSGRARDVGVLTHPDDVFRRRRRTQARAYGAHDDELPVDVPPPPLALAAAADGDPPGPTWTMRYPNPATRDEMIAAIAAERPGSDFGERIRSLLDQLEAQGAETFLATTVRRRERGYLMWGAFVLSRCDSELEVRRAITKLDRRNREWKLRLPIRWSHPDGWQATIESSRQMADAYDVVYATEWGARTSDHYDGEAADLGATGLPRSLVLRAPDGATATFDLSDPSETRDLSLTPRVIDWVEAHFDMKKLESDYPHWDDANED